MKAVFYTVCGCKREVPLTEMPKPRISMKIPPTNHPLADKIPDPGYMGKTDGQRDVRCFDLVQEAEDDNGAVYIYLEAR